MGNVLPKEADMGALTWCMGLGIPGCRMPSISPLLNLEGRHTGIQTAVNVPQGSPVEQKVVSAVFPTAAPAKPCHLLVLARAYLKAQGVNDT